MTGQVEWWEAWDHQVHGFAELGEVASTAACGRIVATDHLVPHPEYARWCGACLLICETEPATAWPTWDRDQTPQGREGAMKHTGGNEGDD